jgi:mono/diheme cytochrome c family protein
MMGRMQGAFLLGFLTFVSAVLAQMPTGAKLTPTAAKLKRGQEVYQYWCWNCHGTGSGKPGTKALQAKYKATRPADLEQRTDLTPAVTKAFVRKGVSIMPMFRETEISDADLDALAAYLARSTKARSANENGTPSHQ